MQKALLIKSVLVAAILAVLALPLRMIDGLVKERASRQQAMAQELADESYAPQMLAGPVLSIPYIEEFDDENTTASSAMPIEKRRKEGVARFFPTTSSIEGSATVETKSRGLFKARVFNWRARCAANSCSTRRPTSRARRHIHESFGESRSSACCSAIRVD